MAFETYRDHQYPRRRSSIERATIEALQHLPTGEIIRILDRAEALALAESNYWHAVILQRHIDAARMEAQ